MMNLSALLAALMLVMNVVFVDVVRVMAQSPTGESATPKAIEGFDEDKVKDDPICDSSRRPVIETVEPDEVKPGDKIVVTGDFGKSKECLHHVTIGSEEGEQPTYVDAKHVEVTVPNSARQGMTFLNVQTGGGSARAAILVQRK
ncbi:MAG: hypothetical protein NPIRA02_27730 [Nitrospirales bacterium]|nr:MAG: hypothetical protein NPIRA02_27730 [Nitrospirales bacterium]